ncbi:MAG: hypothetical protein P4L86_04845, partial [Mycobacterium sp.]|nr:hypothetical protein [Mycobacterium sp.]
WLDGKLESANEWLLVYTIPVSSTFAKIEGVMAYAQQKFPGCRWFYGNVYDPKDGTTPLNWWVDLKEADFERLRNINQM